MFLGTSSHVPFQRLGKLPVTGDYCLGNVAFWADPMLNLWADTFTPSIYAALSQKDHVE